jgi:hypothetical protein
MERGGTSRSFASEAIMDMQTFIRNRSRFPLSELAQYAGKYVAWSCDGMRIIASDKDQVRLDRELQSAGYDTAEVLVSFMPHPDEVILGGGGFSE